MPGDDAVYISQRRSAKGSVASRTVDDDGDRSTANREELLEVSSQGTRWRNILGGQEARRVRGSSAAATAIGGAGRTEQESGTAGTRAYT
jgi:hypothetical protein